ncbi:MAG: hypothetical protein IJ776_09260 [Paludibacteraceae bacterium]|nr:hypothetical protein [Paludibacteraceae bacterium]
MNPTKEQIEQYREEVIEELKALPINPQVTPANYKEQEVEKVKNYPDHVLINAMQYNTPKEFAEMIEM